MRKRPPRKPKLNQCVFCDNTEIVIKETWIENEPKFRAVCKYCKAQTSPQDAAWKAEENWNKLLQIRNIPAPGTHVGEGSYTDQSR
jgi:hypothetical protein